MEKYTLFGIFCCGLSDLDLIASTACLPSALCPIYHIASGGSALHAVDSNIISGLSIVYIKNKLSFF